MPGFTPFTSNYRDLSDENGYQFEFHCDICGSGYQSEFIRSKLGTAGNILGGASSLLGGFFGSASNVADKAKEITDRGARDEALKKASDELMHYFQRCPRNNLWVDETCWNEERGLCVNCAPKLAAEMEAARSQAELSQMQQAMSASTQFSGDLAPGPRSARTAASPSGRRSSARTAARRSACASARPAAATSPPGQVLRQLRQAGRLTNRQARSSAGERSALRAEPGAGRQWGAAAGADWQVARGRCGAAPRLTEADGVALD